MLDYSRGINTTLYLYWECSPALQCINMWWLHLTLVSQRQLSLTLSISYYNTCYHCVRCLVSFHSIHLHFSTYFLLVRYPLCSKSICASNDIYSVYYSGATHLYWIHVLMEQWIVSIIYYIWEQTFQHGTMWVIIRRLVEVNLICITIRYVCRYGWCHYIEIFWSISIFRSENNHINDWMD